MIWAAAIWRLTALGIPQLNGQTPEAFVTGSTPDISPYAMFDFFEKVYYSMPVEEFPYEKRCVGYWIGVAENCVDDMAMIVLTSNGRVVVRKDVWAIPDDDRKKPAIQASIAELEKQVAERLGKDDVLDDPEMPKDLFVEDEVDEPEEPDSVMPKADSYTPEEMDEYISAELLLPHGGDLSHAKVIGRKRDRDGKPVGTRNPNPILDSRLYEVEFPDGSTETFTANTIIENLYAQVDDEGCSYQVLKEITDHRSDGRAISKDDGFTISSNGEKRPRVTTAGWQLQVEWADGSSSWVHLKDLKESNPIEVAEYAVANKIAEEPAFAWWVCPILRRHDRIIRKVKSRYWKRTHKYGVELPKSVKEVLAIDARTGTDL